MEIDGRLQSKEGLATFVEYIGRLLGIKGEIDEQSNDCSRCIKFGC